MILPFDYIGYKRLSENKRFPNHRWYSNATWGENGWMVSIHNEQGIHTVAKISKNTYNICADDQLNKSRCLDVLFAIYTSYWKVLRLNINKVLSSKQENDHLFYA